MNENMHHLLEIETRVQFKFKGIQNNKNKIMKFVLDTLPSSEFLLKKRLEQI